MQSIEENSERLTLLQKTLSVEHRQKKRLLDISIQKERQLEQANTAKLLEGYTNCTTTDSILDQEDALRKTLVDAMVKNSTPSDAPTVKVLTNMQGKLAPNCLCTGSLKKILNNFFLKIPITYI